MNDKKIAVFYGTSEGVEILNFLADFNVDICGFVATDYGKDMRVPSSVKVCVGRLEKSEMADIFAREKFDFVIDATHNFAVQASENIRLACGGAGLDYMRVNREVLEKCECDGVKYFEDVRELCEFLQREEGNIFLSTGSKDLELFASFLGGARLFPRVLPMVESLQICERAGIKPAQISAMQAPFSVEANLDGIRRAGAKFFVTKQTGKAGGYFEKLQAAKIAGVTLCVIMPKQKEACGETKATFSVESLKAHLEGVLFRKSDEGIENGAAKNCEELLAERIKAIVAVDKNIVAKTQRRFDAIAKPLNGLGEFEDMVSRLSGISGSLDFAKKCTIVACADNGIVARGVTQTDSSVTAIVAGNIAKGEATVAVMSKVCGTDVFPVDVGMLQQAENVPQYKTMNGTRDFLCETAMDKSDAIAAILAGMDMVKKAKAAGYNMVATGEMGIGNTTTSSAICAVLLGCDVKCVTGKGAGLSAAGVARKIDVITAGIEKHKPNSRDAIDILCKVGGLDIACMCGMFLGGGESKVAIICDGFISAVAAALAQLICPHAVDYMFASHLSAEGGARLLLDKLGLKPVIHARMALGEGTGAVAMFPLVDMAIAVLENMPSFGDINIEEYKPL